MKRASRIAIVIGVLATGFVTTAHAQNAADRETARALFDDGKKKRDAGNIAGALESFKGADAIMHAPTTGLAVARSLAALGRLVEARDAALQIEQFPPAAKESAAFTDARKSARELAAELAPRIPSLTVVVKGVGEPARAGDPTVSIDGVVLPPAVMKVPRRLDPGKHVVVAGIAGGEVKGEITLAERDTKTIELDVTELVSPKPGGKVEPQRPAQDDGQGGSYSPLLWIGIGVAVAGAAVGSVTGLVSMGKTSDVESGCANANKCPPSTHDSLDDARTFATVSTVSFITAGAGLGVAVVALMMGRTPARQTASSIQVTPWIGAGNAGVVGSF